MYGSSKVFICTKILFGTFLNSIDIFNFVQDFVIIVIYFVVLLLWVIEFGRIFELYKIHWINQNWLTILQDRSKIYISMFCQAFWVVKLFFDSNFLYAYSYFCSKNHSKSVCFSHQNTEVNFWVLLQKSVLLIV